MFLSYFNVFGWRNIRSVCTVFKAFATLQNIIHDYVRVRSVRVRMQRMLVLLNVITMTFIYSLTRDGHFALIMRAAAAAAVVVVSQPVSNINFLHVNFADELPNLLISH